MATSAKPRDVNQLAKGILDQATGVEPRTAPPPAKDGEAAALGSQGGKKGGPARAAKLTAAERSAIAKKAAEGRWKKS